MELKAIARMIAKRFICQSTERESERDNERTCSLELASILRELDSLQACAGEDSEMVESVMKINNEIVLLTDCFEQIGFEKGFLYGVAFVNETSCIRMSDI